MSVPGSVLIVGGGIGGFTVARELRRRGFEGELTLVDPQGLPYDRPPLSKDYLTGESDAHRLLLAPPAWYAEHDVAVVAERVERLALPDADAAPVAEASPAAGSADASGPRPRVVLADGGERTADAMVLAPGGRPRPMAVPGGDHPDLIVLRTRNDADRLAGRLHVGARVAVIGGGFTGAEVASAAREQFADVTLISSTATPALTAVGPALAARLHAEHAARGVETLTGTVTRVEHATPDDAAGPSLPAGHRLHVRGLDGTEHTVDADTVVVAVGIVPDVDLADAAGLETDRGIFVDAAQRTSHPNVYAVGDAAQPRGGAGSGPDAAGAPAPARDAAQHWEPAMLDGAAAAAALLGEPIPERGAAWFWSDRHGQHLEGVGVLVPPAGGRIVDRMVRGRPVACFALDAEGRLRGAASVDDPMTVKAARRIIDRGIVVDPERLADPSVPVKALLRG